MIASHYAEPVDRTIAVRTELRSGPGPEAEAVRLVEPGEAFAMLDDTLGWAWGYAGGDRRVGYVKSAAVAAR